MGERSLLEGLDDAPTQAIVEQKRLLDSDYQTAIQKFNQFLQTDVVASNNTMTQFKLSSVVQTEALQP
jgi:hypothetical protein